MCSSSSSAEDLAGGVVRRIEEDRDGAVGDRRLELRFVVGQGRVVDRHRLRHEAEDDALRDVGLMEGLEEDDLVARDCRSS